MKVLRQLLSSLKRKKQTIAVIESVTGGYVSYLFTRLPGASQVFSLGLIPYALGAKKKLFTISEAYLKETQGVSEYLAGQLAKKVRTLAGTDFGASIVGFAGPQAPRGMKGMVCMAVADRHTVYTAHKKFKGPRDRIRRRASFALIRFIAHTLTR